VIENNSLGVSVLLPVFFREVGTEDIRLLRRALESIRQQEFPQDYEILLLDDGSATPVEGLAPHLGYENLENVRFVRNQTNQGLVYTLNRGLTEARHPLIARLDADDRWLPTKIKKQLDLLAVDRDLTITATGMTLVTPEGQALEAHVRPGDWTGILGFFVEVGCPFPHGSVIARRDIYTMLGGYPHNPISSHCEDYTLWGTWLRFFKPAMIEEALYDYTVSSSSVSAKHGEQQRRASGLVNLRFRNLNLVERLPNALMELASVVGCSVLEAGVLAYKMWRFHVPVRLPSTALGPLHIIMPDRSLITSDQDKAALDPSALWRGGQSAGGEGRSVSIRAA
jgi:glycosyltransferase involved in cell wall biosynthesis